MKAMKKAYALLFDGYADWELGYALAELRRSGSFEVVSVGFSEAAVVSMGGLRVTPETTLAQVNPEDILIFILPGGYLWEGSYPRSEIEALLKRLEKEKIPMAAICAATTVLARAGILEGRKHTSNSISYLSKMAPGYAGHDHYVDTLSARDQQVITASGLGSVDFTMDILTELNVASPEMRAIWYDAFKYGKYPADFEHDA